MPCTTVDHISLLLSTILALASALEPTQPSKLARAALRPPVLLRQDATSLPCAGNCSGHGHCAGGRCYCSAGWAGDSCATLSPLTSGCAHNCSGHGSCRRARCACDEFYTGDACDVPVAGCANFCSGHGRCVGGACLCDADRTGRDCALLSFRLSAACGDDCGGSVHGVCVAGSCTCFAPWAGPTCAVSLAAKPCPSNCSSRGACDPSTGRCSCAADYGGDACEFVVAERRRTILFVAGSVVTALLCLALGGVVAWGRLVVGLSFASMRHGRWTPPEDEGWKVGTATNGIPGARFERYQPAGGVNAPAEAGGGGTGTQELRSAKRSIFL